MVDIASGRGNGVNGAWRRVHITSVLLDGYTNEEEE
jgi:hypothetical protein